MSQFFIQWFWYLIAFAVGALVAYLVASSMVKARTEDEAFADLPTSTKGADR